MNVCKRLRTRTAFSLDQWPPDSGYYPALNPAESGGRLQGSGWEERSRPSLVLTNELANGALACLTVTGQMRHRRITSNPRPMRAVTPARYLSPSGQRKLRTHALLLWCSWSPKAVRLIIRHARKITLILIIITSVWRKARILLFWSSDIWTVVDCCHLVDTWGAAVGAEAAVQGS